MCIPGLTEAAAVNARIALHVANLAERPAARIDRSHVEEILHRYDREPPFYTIISVRESLELLDLWPTDHAIERYFTREDRPDDWGSTRVSPLIRGILGARDHGG